MTLEIEVETQWKHCILRNSKPYRIKNFSEFKTFPCPTITSKNNETFLVLNIFFIWRSLYPYNSIFYDLSPPSPIHNVEDILFSKKCGLVSLQQHCFRGEGGSKYKVSKIFAPDCRGRQNNKGLYNFLMLWIFKFFQ